MEEYFCLTVGDDAIVATVEDGYVFRYIRIDDNGEWGIVNIMDPPKLSDLLDQGVDVGYDVSAEVREELRKMTKWSIIAGGVEVKLGRFMTWSTTA